MSTTKGPIRIPPSGPNIVGNATGDVLIWNSITNQWEAGPQSGATGPAGGDLGASYPDPTVVAVEETSGPTRLAWGSVPASTIVARVGTFLVGVAPASLLTGAATISITAASLWASLTNGASGISQIETTTNKVNTFVVDFLTAVQSFAEVDLELPADYDGGTISAIFFWLANSASANSVVWGIAGRAFGSASALDQAFGTAVEVTTSNTGTNLVNITAATAAVTLAGTPAAGQHAQLRFYRKGSGADNLAATARLLGVRLSYTRA